MKNIFSSISTFTLVLSAIALSSTFLTGQNSFFRVSGDVNFSKPLNADNENSFSLSTGYGMNLQKGWTNKKNHIIAGCIMFNRIRFTEKIPNLVFGEDILNGTKSSYEREVSLYEAGGGVVLGKEFYRNNIFITPSVELGFSRIFGDVSYQKTEGNGPERFEQNDLEIPKYTLISDVGIELRWSLGDKNFWGIRPSFSYRYSKIESSDLLASSSFSPNTVSIEFLYRHNIK